jgi:hypothetical protein
METTHLARNVTCGMAMAGVGQIFKVEHHAGVAVFWGPSSHRKFALDALVTVDVPTDSGESDPYGAEIMRLAGPPARVDLESYLD